MKNYYAILGLNKDTANDDDIKKSYKKLAMQHHPDRGGDAEKFKEISEAYAVLSDKDKRRSYDFTGEVSDFDFSVMDIFNSFFENIRKPQMTSEDRYVFLNVSLEEVMNGSEIRFRLKRRVLNDKPIECPKCKGKGHIYKNTRFAFNFNIASSTMCMTCQGTGLFYRNLTFRYENTILDVDLKPGTPEGFRFSFARMSDEEPGCITGDLYLVVKYRPHKFFTVDQMNLYCTININWLEYFSGFERCIHHLNGEKIKIKSESILAIPSELCIRGLGLDHGKDLIIKINIITTGLSPQTIKNIIREISQCQTKTIVTETTDKTFHI